MERLTEKIGKEYILPYHGENLLSVSTSSNTIMIDNFKWETTPRVTYIEGYFINKLGKLEDVLEKYGIESAEELDKFIQHKDCQIDKWKQDYENCSKLEKSMSKEHQYCLDNWRATEQELAELKQKTIVLEKAFELACDPRDDWGGEEYSGTEFDNYHDYFIA